MQITLSKPPALNALYGTNKFGAKYLKPAGREWKEKTAWLIKGARGRTNVVLKGEVGLEVKLFTCRHQDMDGILKILFDSIQYSGLIEDDYQIADLRVIRRRGTKKQERIEIEIMELD